MESAVLPRRRSGRRLALLAIGAFFLLPIAARGAIYFYGDGPRSWREADWSSVGMLPGAAADPAARVLIVSGRTGGWKGVFSVHSWIVLKPSNATSWRRYDVVGWGRPIRINGWAPDSRWYGNVPQIVADIRGPEAARLIPKIEAAIRDYPFSRAGDYRIWPGPNSNTFVATVLRAVPELGVALPSDAVGRDYRPGPYAGLTDSGTGFELNLGGVLGIKAGWVEGLEINLFGMVAGIDLREAGVKVPAFGLVSLPGQTAHATPGAK